MIHDLNQHYTIEVVGERQFHIHRFMLKKLFNHMAGLLESDGDQTSQFVISNVVSADIFIQSLMILRSLSLRKSSMQLTYME